MRMTPFEEFDRLFERILHGGIPRLADKPAWYGCEVAVGPDGIPYMRQFGNVPPGTPAPSAGRGLPIDVIDDKDGQLRLVAEIPGVEKDDIEVTIEEGAVAIRARRGQSTYEGSVPVQSAIDGDSVKATYKNGILEVTFSVESRSKGQRVRVE